MSSAWASGIGSEEEGVRASDLTTCLDDSGSLLDFESSLRKANLKAKFEKQESDFEETRAKGLARIEALGRNILGKPAPDAGDQEIRGTRDDHPPGGGRARGRNNGLPAAPGSGIDTLALVREMELLERELQNEKDDKLKLEAKLLGKEAELSVSQAETRGTSSRLELLELAQEESLRESLREAEERREIVISLEEKIQQLRLETSEREEAAKAYASQVDTLTKEIAAREANEETLKAEVEYLNWPLAERGVTLEDLMETWESVGQMKEESRMREEESRMREEQLCTQVEAQLCAQLEESNTSMESILRERMLLVASQLQEKYEDEQQVLKEAIRRRDNDLKEQKGLYEERVQRAEQELADTRARASAMEREMEAEFKATKKAVEEEHTKLREAEETIWELREAARESKADERVLALFTRNQSLEIRIEHLETDLKRANADLEAALGGGEGLDSILRRQLVVQQEAQGTVQTQLIEAKAALQKLASDGRDAAKAATEEARRLTAKIEKMELEAWERERELVSNQQETHLLRQHNEQAAEKLQALQVKLDAAGRGDAEEVAKAKRQVTRMLAAQTELQQEHALEVKELRDKIMKLQQAVAVSKIGAQGGRPV